VVGQFQLQTGEWWSRDADLTDCRGSSDLQPGAVRLGRRPPATPAPAARQVAHRIDRSDLRISGAAGAPFFGAIRVDPRDRRLVRSNGPTPVVRV